MNIENSKLKDGTIQQKNEIRKLKQTIAELEEKHRMLEYIISITPGHLYWKDTDQTCLGCNENFAKTLHMSPKDIIGKQAHEFLDKKNANSIQENDQEIMDSDNEKFLEEVGYDKKGKKAYYLTRKVPLHNEAGNVTGLLGISIDITSKKESEALKHQRKLDLERTKCLKILAASIAHELRTPIAAIQGGIKGLEQTLPRLIEGYQKAIATELTHDTIRKSKVKVLETLIPSMLMQLENCHHIIEIQLKNIGFNEIYSGSFQQLSIVPLVKQAIQEYPLHDDEKKKIHESIIHDFSFYGDPTLTKHIIWNVLKNALYFIKAANKGVISIWTETNKYENKLHFKDTSKGMSKNTLKKIFNQFYTETDEGTGLGLNFCNLVMKAYGGTISCNSMEGEYSEFIFTFPSLEEYERKHC